MEIIQLFSDAIKLNRKKQLMTQQDLANKAGVGVATIRDLERGATKDMKLSTMQELLKALNLNFSLHLKGRQ